MRLLSWLRLTPSPGALPRPAQREPPQAPVEVISIEVRALVSAWREHQRRLVLPTTSSPVVGARVVVLVSGVGDVTIPLSGIVTGEGEPGAIQVDADRLPALRRVLAFVEGTADEPRVREPRYGLKLPAVVSSRRTAVYMTTFSVSRGGCGLAWSGLPPHRGSAVHVRLGSGAGAASFVARVCWVHKQANTVKVGVRFMVGQERNLVTLLDDASRGALSM